MARRSRHSRPSGLPHLVVGLALGLAVAAGVYFSNVRSGGVADILEHLTRGGSDDGGARETADGAARPARASDAPAPAARSTSARPSNVAAPAGRAGVDTEPSFDFYEILPQSEVRVPEAVERVARPATPAAPAAAPGRYLLQTGSFRAYADADRMQANLALLGVESQIQKVALDGGDFHRVRIGPLSDPAELNRVRNTLQQAGIDSLVMKLD